MFVVDCNSVSMSVLFFRRALTCCLFLGAGLYPNSCQARNGSRRMGTRSLEVTKLYLIPTMPNRSPDECLSYCGFGRYLGSLCKINITCCDENNGLGKPSK